jgi:penicillin-insensitive murein endopeptidase
MNLSPEDCSKWRKNKLVNPLTGRKIQEGKGIYKDLEKACRDKASPKIDIGFDEEDFDLPKKVGKKNSLKKALCQEQPEKYEWIVGKGCHEKVKKNQSPKKQSPKKQSPKKQSPKKQSPKKQSPKKQSPKKQSPKKQSPKKQSPKKQSPKKQSPKKQSPNQNQPFEDLLNSGYKKLSPIKPYPKKPYNPNQIRASKKIDAIYRKAKNFEDLLDINILYIQNKIRKTIYFSGPIDNEVHLNLDNLIKLHKVYNIYTTSSQPNFNDGFLIQKSYLSFVVKEELGKKLAPLLFASPYIYTAMYTPSISKDNFPSEKYNVTKTWMTGWRDQSDWSRAGFLDYHDHFTNYIPSHGFKNVSEILKNCYVFYIANKDDTNVDTDVVLLDILNNM